MQRFKYLISVWILLLMFCTVSVKVEAANEAKNGLQSNVVGLVTSEAKVIGDGENAMLEIEVMMQGEKKVLKTTYIYSVASIEVVKSQLRMGNLYEFALNAQGDILIAANPEDTFRTLFSRGKPKDPINWIADSAFVFDMKDYGVELSNGKLVAAGWVIKKDGDKITIGDGNAFSENYIVSPNVKVYEINRDNYSNSKISSLEAVQASTDTTRKQAFLVFDQSYANSKIAKVAEIYYFSVDAPMTKESYVMYAPWKWGQEPFNLLGDVYCVGDKEVEIYLLDTPKGLVLVDTGWPNSTYQYFINIKKLGFDPRKIAYIILSHGHMDHYGSVNQFVKLNPDAKVLMSADDYPYLMSQKVGIKIDGFYRWEEYMDFGSVKIKPISTPGHTPGTASFILDVMHNGKSYKAGYMGGYGVNGMTQADLKASSDPADVLKRRLQFRDSLMNLQQNESVDFVAPQHINQYPLLEKWAKRVPGVNPFVDINHPDKSQFVKQMERRIEVIKTIIADDGPKFEPIKGFTGYIVSEPKIIPGWGRDVGYLGLDIEPAICFIQLSIINDKDNKSRVLRTKNINSMATAMSIKEKLKLGDHVEFDLDEVEDIIVDAHPENTFRNLNH